jgi:hypothetical protein
MGEPSEARRGAARNVPRSGANFLSAKIFKEIKKKLGAR